MESQWDVVFVCIVFVQFLLQSWLLTFVCQIPLEKNKQHLCCKNVKWRLFGNCAGKGCKISQKLHFHTMSTVQHLRCSISDSAFNLFQKKFISVSYWLTNWLTFKFINGIKGKYLVSYISIQYIQSSDDIILGC